VARVRVCVRPADQHRRCARQPAARETGSSLREKTAAHGAWRWLRAAARRRGRIVSEPSTRSAVPRFFGLRLGLWYATLFVVGSLAIVFVTYYLTAASMAQRDQDIIRAKLADYAAAYARGGARVLAATVRAEQQAAPERLFVRVVDRGVETVVLS